MYRGVQFTMAHRQLANSSSDHEEIEPPFVIASYFKKTRRVNHDC